jgi:hypothetical protein
MRKKTDSNESITFNGETNICTTIKVPRQCPLVLMVEMVEEKARRSEVKKVEMNCRVVEQGPTALNWTPDIRPWEGSIW